MRSFAAGVVVGLISMSAGAVAHADTFEATRSEDLVPWSHRIDVTIHRGYADIATERTVFNGGDRHDQATFFLDLPAGAVATRLRTQGTLDGRPHWFEGELLEAEAAAARYRELTGIGGYYPKDPALLSWRSQSMLALQVFPCPPGEFKRVAYTLRVPTEYAGGRDRFQLPVLGDEMAIPRVTVSPGTAGDSVFVGERAVAPGSSWFLTEEVELSLRHRAARQIEGALASIRVGEDAVTQFRIDAAERISSVPTGAFVVVLVDGSQSYGRERTRASIGAARSYLAHFQGTGAVARAAVFDRDVRPLGAHFEDAGSLLRSLDAWAPESKNGSHLDRALEFAVQAFRDAPAGAPRRLLVLTDTLTRAAVGPSTLREVVARTGAILHLASVSSGAPSLDRDDDHAYAALARQTGGVTWAAVAEPTTTSAQSEVFEEWARPLRFHHVELAFAGAEMDAYFSDMVDEGESFGELTLTKGRLSSVEMSGELWSRPVRRTVFRSPDHDRRWAGLFFGSDLLDLLDEEQHERLAWQGRVVSPVTSFLAIEPGVRPSTEGLEWGSGTGGGLGFFGRRSPMMRMGAGGHAAFDRAGWLTQNIAPMADRCAVRGRARLSLETTLDEIVDVRAFVDGGREAEASCIVEAVWELALDPRFSAAWEAHEIDA